MAVSKTFDSLKLLNEVQSFIIDYANREGIELRKSFKTVEEFKKFVIAFTIKSLLDLGVEMQDAFDMVMGSGKYNELVEKIWEAGQVKAEAAVV